jgi:hypothetical protein
MERCEVCATERPLCFHDEFQHVEIIRCRVCREADRIPWDILVGVVLGLGMQMAQHIGNEIRATCHFYGRSENELWSEVDKTLYEYTHEPLEERPNGS